MNDADVVQRYNAGEHAAINAPLHHLIGQLWDTCDVDDVDVAGDQWWHVRAECEHTKVEAVSHGPLDLDWAFRVVLAKFRIAHEQEHE